MMKRESPKTKVKKVCESRRDETTPLNIVLENDQRKRSVSVTTGDVAAQSDSVYTLQFNAAVYIITADI